MTNELELLEWWERRSDDQRIALKQAAQQGDMGADTVQLLINTRCPGSPIGTKWESQPQYAWSWPESVRTFIVAQ